MYLKNLTWTNWGAKAATGRGTLVENTCDCASGGFRSEPATITLSRIARRAGHLDYGYVTVTPAPPNKYKFGTYRGWLRY